MLKKHVFGFLLFVLTISLQAQYATNFICNDCSGNSHNLFEELNSGKVVVLCWVMPCASCILPSVTTHAVVKSYQTSNPGKVVMYIVDDYANTNCTSLTGWVNNNGMGDATVFSNASIKMSDYGSTGMPKVVVVADYDHAVFYNANNSVNGDELKAAIDRAIDATITSIAKPSGEKESLARIFPNPTKEDFMLSLTLDKKMDAKLSLFNPTGNKCASYLFPSLAKGENILKLSTGDLPEGIYLVVIETEKLTTTTKLCIRK